MTDMLKKIYDNVLADEPYTLELRRSIDSDVKALTEKYASILNQNQLETLTDDLFAACHTAELTGFELGIRFMKNL